ncbi:MAG: hypothetical protein II295_05075 [Akkermansia sp.]|nr:hypothetical protein [Akkermansia sp.]
MNTRHITRFTYKFTNFQGWRVAITRQGVALARYFSDKQYGDPDIALAEATQFRDQILAELALEPARTQEILMKYRAQPCKLVYPTGLKPASTTNTADNNAAACSMRSNKVMLGILRGVCQRLQLDTASVLKLSLYLFTMQYGIPESLAGDHKANQEMHAKAIATEDERCLMLQRMIDELESRAQAAGLPSFQEFATGRPKELMATTAVDVPEEPIQVDQPPPVAEPPPPLPHAAEPTARPRQASPRAAATAAHTLTSHHFGHLTAHPHLSRDNYLHESLTTADMPTFARKHRGRPATRDINPAHDIL